MRQQLSDFENYLPHFSDESQYFKEQISDPISSPQDNFFTEMSDILTLKYIFEKTRLIIDERVLTLSQERIDHIFPKQNKVIAKFLSIY